MVEREPEIRQENEYKLEPITAEKQEKRGWTIEINGKVESPIEIIKLENKKMGVRIDYGQRPEGFDGPVLKERGGGGSVTIPYFENDGELYIGVIEEFRPTCTDGKAEKILNVPRGFMDPDSPSHFHTAVKELGEETGYLPLEKRVKELPGEPMNPNSTYFLTGKDKGVHVYGVKVYDFEVEKTVDSEELTEREFGFDKDVVNPMEGDKLGEKIGKSRFIHWTKAAKLVDMFTAAGVARLLSEQHTTKKMS